MVKLTFIIFTDKLLDQFRYNFKEPILLFTR